MDEREAEERKYADLQFHLIKVTLAKAALAGVTYEPFDMYVSGRFFGGNAGQRPPRTNTEYIAVLPDGSRSPRGFEDELAAAIWALTVLDPQTPVNPIEGFMLKPENEQ